MLRLLLAAALIFQAASAQEADKAAAELLQKLEDQVMKAKTLHVLFEAAPAGAGREEKLKGELKIGENGAFSLSVEVTERAGRLEKFTLKSDGKSVVAEGGPRGLGRTDVSKWKPESVQRCLKRATNEANFLGIFLVMGRDTDPESVFEQFAAKDAKIEGKEKVGDVEATIVSFGLDLKEGPAANRMSFKSWVDPVKLRVLKREMNFGPEAIIETTTKFELNAAFPADAFEFQNAAMLLDARSYQAAASVLLHARYTGRLPKTLEDLTRKPADLPAGVLWPEGGFWIGGAIPKDIPYASDATHFTVGALKEPIPAYSPVGAPTDRVKKFFEARVRIQLLKAAAEAFRRSSTFLPKAPQDLLKKPESVRFWPEGGWVGAGFPPDPWGDAFQIRTEGSFTVGVANPKGRMLKKSDLTAAEKTGLDLVARPPLGEKDAAEVEALIKQLGGEKLTERETATKGIVAKGGGALHIILAALGREKDPEVVSRLSLIRDQIRSDKATWELEVKGFRGVIAGGGGDPRVNERMGYSSLKTLTMAQADFRSNDRDGNRNVDFYVRDVAGLHALKGATGTETEATAGQDGEQHVVIKLIETSLAKADATDDRWTYPVLGISEIEPKSGYVFAALRNYEEGGKSIRYHDGSGRNADRFGFVAYPAEYGVTGRLTFIVNEDNTIWQKDVGDELIDTFPAAPNSEGWTPKTD